MAGGRDDARGAGRVRVDGLLLRDAAGTFRVRGVTYGSFLPRVDGALLPEPRQVRRDIEAMASAGLNTVRVYSRPTVDLLDAASSVGMRVLVGLQYDDWRMHVRPSRRANRAVLDAGRAALDEVLQVCAGNPCVLAVSVGNEVPADVVRVHGRQHVEDVLARLVAEAQAADPGLLATYTSYPTTEHLTVPGQDLATFNVFLDDAERLRAYLERLQLVAGEIPLLLTEVGVPAEVHGRDVQASRLAAQLRVVDEVGIAGATVFAWTDEWGVAGRPVEGWGFGITDEERRPKASFDVVRTWARRTLRDLHDDWPRVSVVVCAYDEEATIAECLGSLVASDYPDLEVIVCDDGSRDATADIAADFPVKLLRLEHGGLSAARNAGLAAASGDVVAYLDADAACHPDWPYRVALSLVAGSDVVATGGPNLPVPGAGLVERAVAASPGSPQHVLTSHDRAEHVPGCNMAYRREVLESVGGFEVACTTAGDDVDLCWRLLDAGHVIGFAPTAQVFHHRRGTVRGYLRQQRGYGRAEAMLSGRHRHRFNRLGQARWAGVVYGNVLHRLLRPVVYHGHLGSAPYQPVERRRGVVALAVVTACLPLALPVTALGLVAALLHPAGLGLAAVGAVAPVALGLVVAGTVRPPRGEPHPWRYRALVGLLHVLQPFVRVWGRLTGEPLDPDPTPSTRWEGDRLRWLDELRRELDGRGVTTVAGSPHAAWDVEARRGPLVVARLTTAVVWDWVPMAAVRTRPRAGAPLLVLLAVAAAVAAPWLGAAVAAAALVWAVVDVVVLRRRVTAAIRRTTKAADRDDDG